MKNCEKSSKILLIIGGLNLGLVNAFNFDLVGKILGSFPMIVKVLYILVGLAALYELYNMVK